MPCTMPWHMPCTTPGTENAIQNQPGSPQSRRFWSWYREPEHWHGRCWGSRREVFMLPKKRVTEDGMAGCITNAMHVNLGKLWETVRDREARHAALYGVVKNQTRVGDWRTATTSKGDKVGTQEAKYLSRCLKGEWQHSNCSKAGRDKESIPESRCCPPKTITALLISYTPK